MTLCGRRREKSLLKQGNKVVLFEITHVVTKKVPGREGMYYACVVGKYTKTERTELAVVACASLTADGAHGNDDDDDDHCVEVATFHG